MHSWLSVGAVSLFGTNYMLGLFMGILTACMPESPVRKMFPLSKIHKVLGMTAFGFTVLSICTGIMDQTGRSGCSYVDVLITAVEKNPALNYPSIPNQCKIANGLGIAVPLCAAAAMLAAYLRVPLIMNKGDAKDLNRPEQQRHGDGLADIYAARGDQSDNSFGENQTATPPERHVILDAA
jgi:hypothetical protein